MHAFVIHSLSKSVMNKSASALLSRRAFVAGLPLFLGACATGGRSPGDFAAPVDPAYVEMYAALPDEKFPVPAIDVSKIDPKFLRQIVAYNGPETPGSIVVDPTHRFLYLVQEGGQAMRYGCGVGKAGFDYQGAAYVGRKASWPRWTPTPTMIQLEPERYGPYAGGVPGGLENPLGSRALYLYNNGRDTLYRIHGTTEPWTIGKSVSSGCIRLFNQDIIDLHRRVPVGTEVMVLPADSANRTA